MYDIIVIGAGPAGLTAAIYARRAGKSVLVLEKDTFGGQMTFSPKLENYPGFETISGNELAQKMLEQALALGAEIDMDTVVDVTDGETKTVHGEMNTYEAKSVIIAAGARHRRLRLLVIDESHVTVPQIHAMYGGDRARKDNLVQYGFRLPAARDNRPLTFEEFEQKTGQTVYVSATPADYELRRSEGIVIDQLIRPTGLLDPEIEVRPLDHQVDDLMEEIRQRVEREERVLVTTLTKRMAEEMDEYLRRYGVRSAYIHSDIDTLERVQIMEDLRRGLYDVLVGVNLLREGLDLPEVSLVAILDADKEGFLRDHRSLTQTAGRAARHVNGHVIMYADRITRSMQMTIDETNRRRAKQIAYNEAHHITPTALNKKIEASPLIALMRKEQEEQQVLEKKIQDGWRTAPWQQYNAKELRKAIDKQRKAMLAAAKDLNFDVAARLRDELLQMEDKLQAME